MRESSGEKSEYLIYRFLLTAAAGCQTGQSQQGKRSRGGLGDDKSCVVVFDGSSLENSLIIITEVQSAWSNHAIALKLHRTAIFARQGHGNDGASGATIYRKGITSETSGASTGIINPAVLISQSHTGESHECDTCFFHS